MRTPANSQQGACHLPAARLSASPEMRSIRPRDPKGRQEEGGRLDSAIGRILIVDDDPNILKLVSRMAQSLGYHASTAIDALDALFLLKKSHFEIVLTDYIMPFMDGLQLAYQVKKQQLSAAVIIMTGNCDNAIQDMIHGSDAVDGLLLKPFNLDTMKETLETVSRACIGPWSY